MKKTLIWIATLLFATGSLLLIAQPANADLPEPEAGSRSLCSAWQLSFRKVDGAKNDWMVGRVRLECNRTIRVIRLMPVINREGGGQPSRTLWKKKECRLTHVCTMEIRMADVGGRNYYALSFDPGGTNVWFGAAGGGGWPAAGATCGERDRKSLYCTLAYQKRG